MIEDRIENYEEDEVKECSMLFCKFCCKRDICNLLQDSKIKEGGNYGE